MLETWLIPGTINPTIISGIVNPKNELKIDENVTKTLIIGVDRVLPKTIPNVTAIISFTINGILLYKLIVRSPFFYFIVFFKKTCVHYTRKIYVCKGGEAYFSNYLKIVNTQSKFQFEYYIIYFYFIIVSIEVMPVGI